MVAVFIDESGPFMPLPSRASRVSGVAALVLSSRTLAGLFRDFGDLAKSFPTKDGEVKGSQLNEDHIASVIALLSRYDALVEIVLIDAGSHRDRDVSAFRKRQAEFIGRHAFTNPDQRVRELASKIRASLEVMSNQLFIQAWLTMPLVERVIQTSLLYYALQAPRELSGFSWVIDAKAAGKTASEEFWTQFVLPYSEQRSKIHPVRLLCDGDYSAFARFIGDHPHADDPARSRPARLSKAGIDSYAILTERLAFKDSKCEPGLQLADIVANASVRAFNGRLERRGWEALPDLLAGVEPQVIQFTALNPAGKSGERRLPLAEPHATLMRQLEARRRLVHP